MRNFVLVCLLLLMIICLCGKDSGPGIDVYEIQVFLMRGMHQGQPEKTPLFPGETSIQYIEQLMKNADEVRKQLMSTFGYQQIEFEDVSGFPFLEERKDQTFLLSLEKDFYLRLIIFHTIEENSIPIHITAVQSSDKLDFQIDRERLLNNLFKEKNSILSVRANVPIRQGMILGRALSSDSTQALFLVIQPLKRHFITSQQLYDLEDKYKDLKVIYGEEDFLKFRQTIAEKLGIDNLAEFKISKERSWSEVENLVSYDDLEVKPKLTKSVPPEYPEQARKKGQEGLAMVHVLINEYGKVVQTEIAKSSGYQILDSAATITASQFEFTPAEYSGKAVKVKMTIPFKFRLNGTKSKK